MQLLEERHREPPGEGGQVALRALAAHDHLLTNGEDGGTRDLLNLLAVLPAEGLQPNVQVLGFLDLDLHRLLPTGLGEGANHANLGGSVVAGEFEDSLAFGRFVLVGRPEQGQDPLFHGIV